MRLSLKLATAALAIGLAATPAAAVVETFASFSPIGTGRNIRWVVSANNSANNFSRNATFYTTTTATDTVPGARNVRFSFLPDELSPFITNITASFLMQGTVTNTVATVSGSTITQTNLVGSFSFLTTAPMTIDGTFFATGSNLLSGSFTQAEISGNRNGTSAGLSASTPASVITYTSDFLTFRPNSNFDLSFSMTSINPALNATNASGTTTGDPNKALRSFRAVLAGTFSSDPPPVPFNAVPEPQTWAMLITGFGLAGLTARRRRKTVSA